LVCCRPTALRHELRFVPVRKLAKLMGSAHHSFTMMSVREPDFHASQGAPRRMGRCSELFS
jgi:hypothetical protein